MAGWVKGRRVLPTCAALDADGQLTTLQNHCEGTNLTRSHFYRIKFALSQQAISHHWLYLVAHSGDVQDVVLYSREYQEKSRTLGLQK